MPVSLATEAVTQIGIKTNITHKKAIEDQDPPTYDRKNSISNYLSLATHHSAFLGSGVVGHLANPWIEGQSLWGVCVCLFSKYIHSYPQNLETVSFC